MTYKLSIEHVLSNLGRDVPRGRAISPKTQTGSREFALSLLAAGLLSLTGCGSSLSGDSSVSSSLSSLPSQCANSAGLAAQDLAGQCRGTTLTMGALEIDRSASAATAAVSASLGAGTNTASATLTISWQPAANDAAGYMVYYGSTAETASVLVSDLPADGSSVDPAAPSVTYDSTRDLGLYAGDPVCFRIFPYDASRSLSSESQLVCATA
jgi:hypothetical protein